MTAADAEGVARELLKLRVPRVLGEDAPEILVAAHRDAFDNALVVRFCALDPVADRRMNHRVSLARAARDARDEFERMAAHLDEWLQQLRPMEPAAVGL